MAGIAPTVTTPSPDTSHFILEVSDSFTTANLFEASKALAEALEIPVVASTGHADADNQHMEFFLQTHRPEWQVRITTVTTRQGRSGSRNGG